MTQGVWSLGCRVQP